MKHKRDENKRRRPSVTTVILVGILLAGIGLMAYPTVSDYWNSLHQSWAIERYSAALEELDETDYEALFAAADQYNEHLLELANPLLYHEELREEYENALNITGTGMIGYVSIARIHVELPIYHGTGDEVLNTSAGHLEGTSLPVGGQTRHAVISAHRGLPSAKLFTDLDRLELGDTFTIQVLNRTLTYQVDQILIVEPGQTEALDVIKGEDHVTLQTCTPYGVNTHRMLVRGVRVEQADGEAEVRGEVVKLPAYIVAPAVAIPMLFILLLILMIFYRRKPKPVSLKDVQELAGKIRDTADHSDET